MIVYKTGPEIEAMRRSPPHRRPDPGELRPLIRPGVRTADLDALPSAGPASSGPSRPSRATAAIPASLCVSVNEEIIHGIPSDRVLREGDLVSLDFGVLYDGFYGDAARTYPVGGVSAPGRAAHRRRRGVLPQRPGGPGRGRPRLGHLPAVQRRVEAEGFSVIRSFVGHGIGHALHEEPQVPNFGLPGRGPRLRRGLVLAIEPMIAAGDWDVEILETAGRR